MAGIDALIGRIFCFRMELKNGCFTIAFVTTLINGIFLLPPVKRGFIYGFSNPIFTYTSELHFAYCALFLLGSVLLCLGNYFNNFYLLLPWLVLWAPFVMALSTIFIGTTFAYVLVAFPVAYLAYLWFFVFRVMIAIKKNEYTPQQQQRDEAEAVQLQQRQGQYN